MAANLGAVAAFRELAGLPAIIASPLAIEVSVVYSFAWRHFWTLAARRPDSSPVFSRLVRFQLASAPSSLLTLGVFALLWGLLDVHYLAAQAVGLVPALAWNYFVGERLLRRAWAGFAVRVKVLAGPVSSQPPPGRG
jgi:putative flippase GtrA